MSTKMQTGTHWKFSYTVFIKRPTLKRIFLGGNSNEGVVGMIETGSLNTGYRNKCSPLPV